MPKSPEEIIKTWPKWKQEMAGVKIMEKTLSEHVVEQFKAVMKERGLNQIDVAEKSGVSRSNISLLFKKGRNLTLTTLSKLAAAIGGRIEVNFVPAKTELELLREENERLKKQLGAKRYVENGTLNKR